MWRARVLAALGQSALLAATYCAVCGAIFAWEAWWLRVPPAKREWNAYAPAVRARILRRVAWNLFAVTPAWLLLVNLVLAPWCRRIVGAAEGGYLAMAVYPLGVDVCYYVLHRCAHARALYARVHAQHHEVTVAFAPAAMYCSTVEMSLVNLLSATLPWLALGLGDGVLTALMVLGPLDTTLAHSRWSTHHYLHHRREAPLVQTYGSTLGVVDWLVTAAAGNSVMRRHA